MAWTACWGVHRLMMELEKPPEEMSLAVLSDQLAIAKKNFANLDTSTF